MLDSYTKGKEDGWLEALVRKAVPVKGNIDSRGCGVLDNTCTLVTAEDCPKMVEKGMAAEYWILSAVQGTSAHPLQRTSSTNTSGRLPR